MIESGFDSPVLDTPGEINANRFLESPIYGSYLIDLFSGIFLSIDLGKRRELFDQVNTRDGNYAFVSMIQLFQRIHETRNDQGGNSFSYMRLSRSKKEFLDGLPQTFGTYERDEVSRVIDRLFPSGQLETSENPRIPTLLQRFANQAKEVIGKVVT